MRVALLSFDFGEYCVVTANALGKRADVLLLLPEVEASPHLAEVDGSIALRTFAKPRLRQPLRQIGMALGLLRAIRQFHPDVIHLQGGHLWFNLALPLLRSIALVVTIHDPRMHTGDHDSLKTPQRILNMGYRGADQVIVHGETLKQDVVAIHGVPEHRVHVIPMILPDQAVHDAKPVKEEASLILFFGRIWEYKGLEYLIRAEPLVSAQIPNLKIAIAGRGEDFARYESMMSDRARYEVMNEYVSHENRNRLLQQAAIVVLPYIEATQSAVIPLAYSFGKPVIATTVGALPELVGDGETGLLVPPRDVPALAQAIVRLLSDRELRHQMGSAGKRRLQERNSPKVVAEGSLEVYRLAMESKQAHVESVPITGETLAHDSGRLGTNS